MAERRNRYKQLEQVMTGAILADFVFFILFLVFAGKGIVWAKVVMAVLSLLVAVASIGYLYITKELMRPRSMWMTFAAAAIVICVLFALILNYPSPHPRNLPQEELAAVVGIINV